VRVALERDCAQAEVAIGDDADDAPGGVRDDEAADATVAQ